MSSDMERNQVVLKPRRGHEEKRICIERLPDGKVEIRTYALVPAVRRVRGKHRHGYHLMIFTRAGLESQGWTLDRDDAKEWLETHTSGLRID